MKINAYNPGVKQLDLNSFKSFFLCFEIIMQIIGTMARKIFTINPMKKV